MDDSAETAGIQVPGTSEPTPQTCARKKSSASQSSKIVTDSFSEAQNKNIEQVKKARKALPSKNHQNKQNKFPRCYLSALADVTWQLLGKSGFRLW